MRLSTEWYVFEQFAVPRCSCVFPLSDTFLNNSWSLGVDASFYSVIHVWTICGPSWCIICSTEWRSLHRFASHDDSIMVLLPHPFTGWHCSNMYWWLFPLRYIVIAQNRYWSLYWVMFQQYIAPDDLFVCFVLLFVCLFVLQGVVVVVLCALFFFFFFYVYCVVIVFVFLF